MNRALRHQVGFLLTGVLLWGSDPAAAQGQNAADQEPPSVVNPDGWPSPLFGTVKDHRTGDPLPGAVVRWSGPRSGETVSRSDGSWSSHPLPTGRYEVAVSSLGHSSVQLVVELPLPASGVEVTLSPQAIPLEAFVVTVSRRPQRLADTPVATEILSRREVQLAGQSDLAALLQDRVGLSLEGGHPTGAGTMIQGLDSQRVLVLVDGQPWTGRMAGVQDLSRLPTLSVERIEIVKGPQSTLYGSEAMGGVVNVVTRSLRSEASRAETSITTGSLGRIDLSAGVGGGRGAYSTSLDLARRSLDAIPGLASRTGAWVERRDLHWKGGYRGERAGEGGLEVSASLLGTDEIQRWRSGQLTQFGDTRQWIGTVEATQQRSESRLTLAISHSGFKHLSRRGTGLNPPEPSSGRRQRQERLSTSLGYYRVLGPRMELDAGVDARREFLEAPDLQHGPLALDAVEPFAQLTLQAGPLSLTPGIRQSWSREWGGHTSPRVAILLRSPTGWSFRLSAGHGFRAPDGKELGMEFLNVGPGFGYTVRGDAGLRPEESRNLSLGAEWSRGESWVRGALFRNDLSHFIEAVQEGDSAGVQLFVYRNGTDGLTQGLEVEGGVRLGPVVGEAGWAYLHAREGKDRLPMLGRPEHSGRGRVRMEIFEGGTLAISAHWTALTPVSRNPEASTLDRDAFLRWDLRLSQPLPLGLELSGGVRNLLDVRPRGWPGGEERILHLGLRAILR